MSEKLLLTNMHICGREIAQVFAAELSVEARTRVTEKLLTLMRTTTDAQNDMGPRMMLLGALSAVGQGELAETLPRALARLDAGG